MALPTVIVEVAFEADTTAANPHYIDVSQYAMGFTIRRGRQYELDQIQTGTCDVKFANGDRRFDPTYTLSPYYPYVLPMRKIRVSAKYSGTVYNLFTGFVERWPLSWDAPRWGSVTVTAVDGMAALDQAAIVASFSQELSGARIGEVLTASSWPSSSGIGGYFTLDSAHLDISAILSYDVPTTVLDTGQKQVQAAVFTDDQETSALSHIQDVAAAERGYFFIDGQGRPVFHDSHHRYSVASIVTFADSAFSATRLPYHDLSPDYDVTHVVNEVKVTRTGGVTQTAVDLASRQNYFRRTLSLTPPLVSDTDAADQAGFELTLRKNPALRFDSMTVLPSSGTAMWPYVLDAALAGEIGRKVTVEHTTGASATPQTLSVPCFVEAIQHTVGADLAAWQTTFQLSPASLYSQFFALDAAALDATSTAVLAA